VRKRPADAPKVSIKVLESHRIIAPGSQKSRLGIAKSRNAGSSAVP
jgi:hypothetical protein